MLQRKTDTALLFSVKPSKTCQNALEVQICLLYTLILFSALHRKEDVHMLVQFVFCWFFLTDGEFPNALVVAQCEVLKA
jgi:hypothetical protein